MDNINDDLVGFFNSVPQDRLLDAINSLITEWQNQHDQVTLSVDMSQRGNPLQLSYVGKFHKAPRKTRVIHPSDIVTIVQSSLQSHIFQAVNVIWHQIRGAGIGSHISPTLSNLAVTMIERTWFQTYEQILTAPSFPFLAIRYVDNRYMSFFPKNGSKILPSRHWPKKIFINIQWNWRPLPTTSCWDFW